MKSTINRVFKTADQATYAVDRLMEAGYGDRDISVLMTDETHGKDFKVEVNSKAPEGIAAGGAIGGVTGAIAAGLTAAGAIAFTGGAGVIVAGPIAAALAGAGAGAGAGGLLGGLIGMGMDETEAKQTEFDVENGSVLVSVEVAGDQKDEVTKIMDLAQERDKKQAKEMA